jgi:mono/diheme cytochrome c family protein
MLVPALLAEPSASVEFNRDIRPILSDRCFACHGPDAENRKTPLRLDSAEGAAVELVSGGRALTPGDPAQSKLLERVRSDSPVLRMPPAYAGHDPLSPAEIATLERWVEQGAEFASHWAFRAPARPETPEVRRQDWTRNPIDAFVLARLEQEGLAPSPEADRGKLLRRVSFDLTGLPPSPADRDRFLSDPSPDAWRQAVQAAARLAPLWRAHGPGLARRRPLCGHQWLPKRR